MLAKSHHLPTSGSSEPIETENRVFYPALDGLRTLAVAMVFVVHFLPRLMPYGWLGVQIFFVLSGFLITGILFDTRNENYRFRNFYGRRALRIFPLYYGFLFIVAAVVYMTHGHAPRGFWMWFVYLQNFWWLAKPGQSDILFIGSGRAFAAIGHLWSLAIEEQFYLLWPLLVFTFRDRKRLVQICYTLIVMRLILAAFWQIHLSPRVLDSGIIYRMLPTQWDSFLMGGLLALWLRGTPAKRIRANSGILAAAAVILYGTMLTLLHLRPGLTGGQNVLDYRSGFQATIGLPLSNIASVFLLLAVIQRNTWIYRLCNLSPMRSLGRVSYGLYVFHLPVFVLVTNFGSKSLSRSQICRSHISICIALISTILTVPISYASFYLYEKHFLLLKNRLTSIGSLKKLRAAQP